MDQQRMGGLLTPYLAVPPVPGVLEDLSLYLALLLKWNSRTNLTSIRDQDEIVRRHFGESLALAKLLSDEFHLEGQTLYDFGSGAGFPGAPIAIACPELQVLLIESQTKKASFLKELIRILDLGNCSVFSGRAEEATTRADFVTMRAVDRLDSMISVGKALLVPRGTLAIMISPEQQQSLAHHEFHSVRHLQASNGVHVLLAQT